MLAFALLSFVQVLITVGVCVAWLGVEVEGSLWAFGGMTEHSAFPQSSIAIDAVCLLAFSAVLIGVASLSLGRRTTNVSTEVDHPTTRQRCLTEYCNLTQSSVTLTNMKRGLASTLLLASGLAISACGAPNAAQDSPETVTVKQTVTEYEDPTPAETAPPAGEAAPEAQPEQPAPEAAPAPPAGNHNINVGQVGGDCGTTDSGIPIKAGSATSCEFAAAMFDAALQATFTVTHVASSEVTQVPHAAVTVASPVTKETYNLDCRLGSDWATVTCEKPEDRTVSAWFTPELPDRMSNYVDIVENYG